MLIIFILSENKKITKKFKYILYILLIYHNNIKNIIQNYIKI